MSLFRSCCSKRRLGALQQSRSLPLRQAASLNPPIWDDRLGISSWEVAPPLRCNQFSQFVLKMMKNSVLDWIELPKKLHSELLCVTDGAVASSGGDADLSLFRVFTVDSYQEVSSAQLSLPFSTRPHGSSLLFVAKE